MAPTQLSGLLLLRESLINPTMSYMLTVRTEGLRGSDETPRLEGGDKTLAFLKASGLDQMIFHSMSSSVELELE